VGTVVANRVGFQGDPSVYTFRTDDPEAVAGAGIVYWKEVSAGEREMFARDPDSGGDIVQITSGNGLNGGAISASDITTGILAQANGGTGLDSSSVTDGQLLIGGTASNDFTLATLTAGTDISIVNAGGSITINSTASGTTTFTGLTDTPANYTGAALDILRVNAGATAVEFVAEGSDFLTQYTLLAGRAGGQLLVGGTGTADPLTLRANNTGLPGPIIFEVEPGVEAGRFALTEQFLAGRTTGFAAADVAEFEKNENAAVRLLVQNTTDGTLSSSGFMAISNRGELLQLALSSDAFTPNAGINANEGFLWLQSGIGSMALITGGAAPIRFVTNTVEEMRLLSGGGIVNGSGEGGTVAATGNTLRAPDIVTGGAGNLAGADNTIAAGIGTGIGDAAVIAFHLPIVAATGDNIQTRASRLTLDMVASTTVLTMAAAQAMTVSTAAGDLTLSPSAGVVVTPGTIGPVTGQQHTLPTVASDTFALLAATQTFAAKTFTTPTIASFTNATHDHSNAAGGGLIAVADFGPFQLYSDQLENPNTADWAVNALAPSEADDNNDGITVRAFDATAEEGVGFTLEIPEGATNMIIRVRGRARTGPAGARTIALKLYNRGLPADAAVQAWTAGTTLADIDLPITTEFFQYDEETISLATLSLTAGELTQFELTRVDPAAGTELTVDYLLHEIQVEWS